MRCTTGLPAADLLYLLALAVVATTAVALGTAGKRRTAPRHAAPKPTLPRSPGTVAPPPRPPYPPVPPLWYRIEYEAGRRALVEGRIDAAAQRAATLVEDSTAAFGPEHPYTRWAWDTRAAVVRAAVVRLRSGPGAPAVSRAGAAGAGVGR
ncbi:hypothetical protein ABT095_14885 [Kitasatospora sp. NPDC002227]|uniref:hypothetical protein n=1 Tax=Kitasatospora sp. NPDC002227 TaxID=3154773 RepID=UPI00332810C1